MENPKIRKQKFVDGTFNIHKNEKNTGMQPILKLNFKSLMVNIFFLGLILKNIGGEVGEPSKFPLRSGNTSIYWYPSNIHTCEPSIERYWVSDV